ncbi:MBL fold metallo-hydrolase, partial [Mariniphaga sp.]|uniref:MBL fold metallo-hydrolase n=1 Tax=Mariniphaga sp. TaxID=1954475 RepID=UPI0035655C4F
MKRLPQIFTLKFGINRCYIIKGDKVVMVDAGPPNKLKSFIKQLASFNINPKEIKLIVLTHGDFDHIGSAKEIKEITGAKVAIHENDRNFLEEACFNWPPGVTRWGKTSRLLLKPFAQKIKIPHQKPDIVLSNADFPLGEFGIDGKIIYTPGHTWGSVSVVLNSGDSFVGCMAHHGFPFTLSPNLPIYATDLERLKESWYILLD